MSNQHFKSHIIHLDGSYNSTEGQCELFRGHCTYVKDDDLSSIQSGKTKHEGHFI